MWKIRHETIHKKFKNKNLGGGGMWSHRETAYTNLLLIFNLKYVELNFGEPKSSNSLHSNRSDLEFYSVF